MKKQDLKNLETKIRENISHFYAMAYAVTGEQIGAEKLTEESILYGAKRYGDLMNKDRFFDIVEQRIGKGECAGVEPCDLSAFSDRIIARVRTWNLLSSITKAVSTVTVIGLVIWGAYSLIFPRLYEARSKEVPLMKDTIAIEGDYDISELVNYQRISDKIEISQEMLNMMDWTSYADYLASVVTTPDGTPYLVINHMEKKEETTLPFTLYRRDEEGWHAVGTGDMGGGSYSYGSYTHLGWSPSDIYMFSDNDANIYVLVRLADDVLIYRYDNKTEAFDVATTIPFHENYAMNYFNVCFDADFGETGTAYIFCRKEPEKYDNEDSGGWAAIYRYDTATNTVSLITDELRLLSENSSVNICAKNDLVYVAETLNGNINREAVMLLNIVYPDGYVDFDFFEKGTLNPIVAMEVDKDGKVHIIAEYKRNVFHYIFSEDLSFVKGELGMAYHHYEDTEYIRDAFGAFLGKDGRVYSLEYYYDGSMGERTFVAIGMLDSEDPSAYTYINGFDLIDNIGHRQYQNGKDVWYVTDEYNQGEAFLVYFHINELD